MNKLSLFSGIMGDDLASEWAGIETICCVESDHFCQAVIKKHYPDMPIIGDIHDVTKEKVKEVSGYEWVDIIAGGDPCQARSIAGKRRGRADDRDIWKDMFRVVCEFKPTWVVNENPTGRLTMDFHEVLSDLESQGYETRSFVIPACAVNAPHRRDRLFFVAYSNPRQCLNPTNSICSGRDSSFISDKSSANTSKRRPEQGYRTSREPFAISGRSVKSLTDSDSRRQQQQEGNIAESGRWYSYDDWRANWIEVATALCGMDDGFSNRVARLKALGNTCVPQQVYPIYRAIVAVEKAKVKI